MSNHLGNVLNVITDRKLPNDKNSDLVVDNFTADVVSYSDYYPFGMTMPGRHGSDAGYRYGFQGQEKDDEVKGEGNSLNYEYRMHDPRIGRFFAVDPLSGKYPFYSPYAFSGNIVINCIELEGLEPEPVSSHEFRKTATKIGYTTNQQIGALFESLTIQIVGTTHFVTAGWNHYSGVRAELNGGMPASVRPDGIQQDVGVETNHKGTSYSIEIHLTNHWYEAKATKSRLTFKYRKHQLTGMIDALASSKKDDDEMPSLTLLTTSNAKVGRGLMKYAEERGVRLYQSVLHYDEETGEYQLSDPELRTSGVSLSKVVEHALDWFSDFDDFDFYGKVHKSELPILNNQYSGSDSDPDPAELNDN